jgi:hypothetical protein
MMSRLAAPWFDLKERGCGLIQRAHVRKDCEGWMAGLYKRDAWFQTGSDGLQQGFASNDAMPVSIYHPKVGVSGRIPSIPVSDIPVRQLFKSIP